VDDPVHNALRSRPISLWQALESGVIGLEKTLARWAQLVMAISGFIAVYVSFFVTPQMGFPLLGLCVLGFGWFTFVHTMLDREIAVPTVRMATPIVEVSIAAAAIPVMVLTEGPAYALGSWVPAQLYTVFIIGSILRLDPKLPAILGVVAGLQYGAVYWGLILGLLADPIPLLHQPRMQIVRVLTLMSFGVAGSYAVVAMRKAVEVANNQVRATELFGKYRIGKQIASGGMGIVVEAMYCPEGGFERKVAIKLIHPHLASDTVLIERFREEAQICAQLRHPNIVAALDFGVVGETYFFAMEYVDGTTLNQLIAHVREEGPLPPALVAYIGHEVASALAFAHSGVRDGNGKLMGVVHRDLSPTNVLVDRAGQVKLTDFGVARLAGVSMDLKTTTLVGKPSYMAPEQLQDGAILPAADVWSLAVVLWELLMGKRLFRKKGMEATLLAVLQKDIPNTDIAQWDAFFAKALVRDPAVRFKNGGEMMEALQQLQQHFGYARPDDLAAVVASLLADPAQ